MPEGETFPGPLRPEPSPSVDGGVHVRRASLPPGRSYSPRQGITLDHRLSERVHTIRSRVGGFADLSSTLPCLTRRLPHASVPRVLPARPAHQSGPGPAGPRRAALRAQAVGCASAERSRGAPPRRRQSGAPCASSTSNASTGRNRRARAPVSRSCRPPQAGRSGR